MALILMGSSICPVCKEVLKDPADVTGFPPFVANAKDKLYPFNDAGAHISCLTQNTHGNMAVMFAEKTRELFMLKKCWHSGEVIVDYRMHFSLPLLTSDEAEPLFNYNFLTLHKNNISKWKDREMFLKIARQFIAAGKWANLYDYDFWGPVFKEMAG